MRLRKASKNPRASDLETDLREGMPTRFEMANATSRTARKHREWEIAKRDTIAAWKAAKKAAGDEPDLEAVRPE